MIVRRYQLERVGYCSDWAQPSRTTVMRIWKKHILIKPPLKMNVQRRLIIVMAEWRHFTLADEGRTTVVTSP